MSNLSPTADNILNAARSLIVAGGYNGFSYADIARVVGIRNASIHHHFPTKADLVRTLVARYRAEAAAGLEALDGAVQDPADRLTAYVGYWERCIGDGSAPLCICALLASESPALPDDVVVEVRGHFRSLSGWLASVLTLGAADGRLRLDAPPAAEAETFMAGVHGAMLSARIYDDPQAFGRVVRPMLDRLIAPAA